MKKIITAFVCATFATFTFLPLSATAGTKKNDPDKKEVEKIVKELGDTHYVERMKINSLCSLKFEDSSGEDDFYHIYSASLKEGGYRIIVFDNKPQYLGYYATEFEGVDYEEGAILLDSGESDEDGNINYFSLPIPDKGPAAKVRIDGIPTVFVKAPGADEKAASSGIGKVAAGTGGEAIVDDNSPQYRDWKITLQGKERTFNAIYISVAKGKVTIKDSKRGKTATVPVSALSAEDVEYLKKITAK